MIDSVQKLAQAACVRPFFSFVRPAFGHGRLGHPQSLEYYEFIFILGNFHGSVIIYVTVQGYVVKSVTFNGSVVISGIFVNML